MFFTPQPPWLPSWARRFFLWVGLPCWIAFAGLIVFGKAFEYQALTVLFFGGFFASAAVAAFYKTRARLRGEDLGNRKVRVATAVAAAVIIALAWGLFAATQLGFIPNHAP